VAGCLCSANAEAATPFTWSGQGSAANWSQATNWGNVAPSGSVGTLSFPALTNSACTSSPQTATCYQSDNDQSDLTAAGISIDDGAGYDITGNAITLGPSGITAAPSPSDPAAPNDRFSLIDVPMTLGGAESWSITGGSPNQQLLLLGPVSDTAGDTLGITLQDNAGLTFQDAEVGPVDVVGDGGASDAAIKLGYFDNTGALVAGSLNATNQNKVSLTDGAGLLSVEGTVGPLSATDALVQVGQVDHAGTLTADQSVMLDQDSALLTFINAPGTTSGSDYSQLSTSGTVDLGDSTLVLEDGEIPGSNACELLNPGDVDTLVTATGGLTGAFNGIPNVPGGTPVPLDCLGSGGTPPVATVQYTATSVTATILSAGTAGAATTTTLSATPSSLVTNQPVTLTATVSASGATPTGTVEFYNGTGASTAPIAGCTAQPVTEVEPVPTSGPPSYTATCQTSFLASQAPSISAAFSPADGSNVAASTVAGFTLSVGLATTATAVTVAPTTVGPSQTTLMTATITPSQTGPASASGTVNFLVDGKPVPAGDGGSGCTGVSVVAGSSSSTAQCNLEFVTVSGTSTHAITAVYSGDSNFTASTSPGQTLTTSGPKPVTSKICTAHVGHASVSVTMIDVVVTCKGTKGQRASVSLKLTAKEKTKTKAKTKGRSASATHAKSKPKTITRTVVVGTKTLTLGAGEGETVHVKLNAAAVRILVKTHKLLVTLTATAKATKGTTRLRTQKLTFKARCSTTWAKLKICRPTKARRSATVGMNVTPASPRWTEESVAASIRSRLPLTAADLAVP
jgi:Bacterial Ig-like domain (group 3)